MGFASERFGPPRPLGEAVTVAQTRVLTCEDVRG